MTKKSITLYIVQNAQFDEAGGNLVPFARAFTSLEKAAKFIVSDYNAFCKSFDDMNTLSKDAWNGLADTRAIESPADWPVWLKWTITRQTIKVDA